MQELREALVKACQELFGQEAQIELSRPAEQFGDFSTNVAMQLAPKLDKNPHEIAETLAAKAKDISSVAEASVAGPGFINIRLTDEKLAGMVYKATQFSRQLEGQEIVLEHTDPNPFKEFHIGHAYSNTVGVAIGKLLQSAGAKVHQVTYQGDVGLHIAMAIWGMKQSAENSSDLGKAYGEGNQAYQENESAKNEIETINSSLYAGDNPDINQMYAQGREQSLAAFEAIYQQLGAVFEKNFFESDTAGEGMEIVKQNTGKIFEESDGAIVYKGEKAGLHTRVFITSKGLPTYEAKEIGLAFAKNREYPKASKFIVVTANEIDDYFNVLIAAIKEIDEGLAAKIQHVSHGLVKFAEGKMSSRTGNVKTFTSLEADLTAKAQEAYGQEKATAAVVLGAMKYEFLKHRLGSDFIFDVSESISLEGNSGPYLQYAHARACSILEKAGQGDDHLAEFDSSERSLALKISQFPEVVSMATSELMPHHLCTYLYELAQAFNRFYENNRVVGDERQNARVALVQKYADVLKNGLNLLNIEAPSRI